MPIIAMIANAFAEDVQKCLDAGDCSLEGGEKDEEVQISTEYKKFQILLFYILHNDMFDCFSCFRIC